VDDLSWLIEAERLLCFGGTELTIDAAVLESSRPRPILADECSDGEGTVGPCPTGEGRPHWLTSATTWWIFGPRGSAGPELGIPVWLHPSVGPPPSGSAARITGHFDDPEARGCEIPPVGSSGIDPEAPDIQELLCRERFVITSIESR
jgi:hypothetical protein